MRTPQLTRFSPKRYWKLESWQEMCCGGEGQWLSICLWSHLTPESDGSSQWSWPSQYLGFSASTNSSSNEGWPRRDTCPKTQGIADLADLCVWLPILFLWSHSWKKRSSSLRDSRPRHCSGKSAESGHRHSLQFDSLGTHCRTNSGNSPRLFGCFLNPASLLFFWRVLVSSNRQCPCYSQLLTFAKYAIALLWIDHIFLAIVSIKLVLTIYSRYVWSECCHMYISRNFFHFCHWNQYKTRI